LPESSKNAGTKSDPFQTIDNALAKAKAIRQNNIDAITIHLMNGEYHVSHPLLITPALNNLAIIVEGSEKVRIKGSQIVTVKWTAYNKNILVAELKDTTGFTQLFINGEEQILARYPNYKEDGGDWQVLPKMLIQKKEWLPGKMLQEDF
jgi:hypothetical protein